MRVTTLARRLGSVALVAALGAGLAACGTDNLKDDDKESSSNSSESNGSDSEEGEEGEEPEAAELTELSTEEFYPTVMAALQDAGSFAITTSTTTDGTTEEMVGEARFDGDQIAMRATSTGTEESELIMLDKMIYMKGESVSPDGKWLAIDLTDDNIFSRMMSVSLDPEAMMGVKYPPKKVELIGQEEVDGVETNHYRITVDPSQVIKDMDMEGLEEFLPQELAIEMWVDADNRPRKFVQNTEVESPTGGGTTVTETEGTYSDFGRDVEIEAPPADEISDENPFEM